jgi:hypothetical protein
VTPDFLGLVYSDRQSSHQPSIGRSGSRQNQLKGRSFLVDAFWGAVIYKSQLLWPNGHIPALESHSRSPQERPARSQANPDEWSFHMRVFWSIVPISCALVLSGCAAAPVATPMVANFLSPYGDFDVNLP